MSITVNEARMWLRRNCKFEHQSFDYEDGEGQQLVMEIADPQESLASRKPMSKVDYGEADSDAPSAGASPRCPGLRSEITDRITPAGDYATPIQFVPGQKVLPIRWEAYSEVLSGDSWTRDHNTWARARCADPSFGVRTRCCESQARLLTARVRARNDGDLRR
jgi:hypothetical protein